MTTLVPPQDRKEWNGNATQASPDLDHITISVSSAIEIIIYHLRQLINR